MSRAVFECLYCGHCFEGNAKRTPTFTVTCRECGRKIRPRQFLDNDSYNDFGGGACGGGDSRRDRHLAQFPTLKLYHATSLYAAQRIVDSQTMLPGTGGLHGAGIYFSSSAAAARSRAQQGKDVVLVADVQVGNAMCLDQDDPSDGGTTYRGLRAQGFDSVEAARRRGTDYVVYKSDQVSNIEFLQ